MRPEIRQEDRLVLAAPSRTIVTRDHVLDNEELEAEGKGDQASGNIKQAGEKIKDVFKS